MAANLTAPAPAHLLGAPALCAPWTQYHLPEWPVLLLLAVPVGGVYANLAMCVGLRQQGRGAGGGVVVAGEAVAYPYLLSLACGDILNCLLVMPTALINTFLGEFPGEVHLCRAWFSGDLCLTAAMGLHLCLLSLHLCLTLARGASSSDSPGSGCAFTSPTRACTLVRLSLAWLLALVTALGPLLWSYYSLEAAGDCGGGGCVPLSLEFSIICSSLCYLVPVLLLGVSWAACVGLLCARSRRRLTLQRRQLEESRREKEIENLKQVVHNFTSLSADLDIQSVLTSDKDKDSEAGEKSGGGGGVGGLTRKLSVMSSNLSRRLSSKKAPKPETPSSPKLDRHPSLRYSIKRNTPSMSGSQPCRGRGSMRDSKRRSSRGGGGGGGVEGPGCTVPLLLATGEASSAVSADSMDLSVGEDSSRTPEELDDQAICDLLLADQAAATTGGSGWKRGGSKRSSKRRGKKGSLSTLPSSPTLDRHPSLRYSIKRPRTPSCEEGPGKRGGSFTRSPSTRSQRSFFSRTPSQRSNVSRTPSQRSYSQRSPFARSPQTFKTSPLLSDTSTLCHNSSGGRPRPVTAQATVETVFTFPEHASAANHTDTQPAVVDQPAKQLNNNNDQDTGHKLDQHSNDTHNDTVNEAPQQENEPVKEVEDQHCSSGDAGCGGSHCTQGQGENREEEKEEEEGRPGARVEALQSPVLVVQTATPTKCHPMTAATTHPPATPPQQHTPPTPNTDHQPPSDTLNSSTKAAGDIEREGKKEEAEDGLVCGEAPPCVQDGQELHGHLVRAHSIESLEGSAVQLEGGPLFLSTNEDAENEVMEHAQRRVVKLLGVLALCFTLTHLPNFATIIFQSACRSMPDTKCLSPTADSLLYFVVQWLAYLCSLLNPLVFFAFHRKLLRRLRYC